ncbi:MAG: hypothetical protein KDK76_02430 [Chlamydiia bacterium]|nr:hypothetical protein [Chlamydiia bacterium]
MDKKPEQPLDMRDLPEEFLDIHELEMKMLLLAGVQKQYQGELERIKSLRMALDTQLYLKEVEVSALTERVNELEKDISRLTEKYKQLEEKRESVTKIEVLNALTQQMTTVKRVKVFFETQASNTLDIKVTEEKILDKIKEDLSASEKLEKEIKENLDKTYEEKQPLVSEYHAITGSVDPDDLKFYEWFRDFVIPELVKAKKSMKRATPHS